MLIASFLLTYNCIACKLLLRYNNIINNMDIFWVGLTTLFASTAVFYIVLFSFIFYWHLKKISFVVVPVIFTFEFFIICFFIVSIVTIILQFVPDLIRTAGL